jgi:SAM-dependent methyltransferase
VTETLKQLAGLIRLFGLRTLVRRKRRHDLALPHLRGYVLTHVLWTLTQEGFLDRLVATGELSVPAYSRERHLAQHVLESLCVYLDALKLVDYEDGTCQATGRLVDLLSEPRGVFDLTYGYEPIFAALPALLAGTKQVGRDVNRRGDYIARGSGELGLQLPFPVMCDLIRGLGARRVLDLGCGDLEFLFLLCEELPVRCVGIDKDPATVAYAEKRLRESRFADRIEVCEGDMFAVDELRRRWGDAEVLTAIDVFHEYLLQGESRIRGLLEELRRAFPRSAVVVAEFCLQPRERLRRRPTAFVEHHLFHDVTNQVILPASRWRELFRGGGYQVVTERVFDIVGHGYFVLRPTG